MKILVLQLARLGDILQTLPSLSAYKRQYPQAEIHILVRKRFEAAAKVGTSVDKILALNTSHIIEPLMTDSDNNLSQSSVRMVKFVEELKAQNYTRIVNLSFSPFSSYLTHAIENKKTKVSGYSRFSDGFLKLSEDMSAYFYAQVGVGGHNRLHLSEIFASILGVDLQDEDFQISKDIGTHPNHVKKPYVLVHVGASEALKTFSVFKWQQILKKIEHHLPHHALILVGSREEQERANQILERISSASVSSLVGQTSFIDTFSLAQGASAIVGGDSVFMHIGTLVNTPCLNISIGPVNFWETGPLSKGSRVIRESNEDCVASDRVAIELKALINGETSEFPVFLRDDDGYAKYRSLNHVVENQFEWSLIQSLYIGGPFPKTMNPNIILGLQRCYEAVNMGYEQMQILKKGQSSLPIVTKIMDQVDPLLYGVRKMVPELTPLVEWFSTEKTRIPPGAFVDIFKRTEEIYKQFRMILSALIIVQEENQEFINP